MPVAVDLHQHVWTSSLLEALAARERLPFVRCTDGLTVLHCGGELPYVIDTPGESADRRNQLRQADGIDLAVVALSSPIGIEALPRDTAAELISAYLDGALALGGGFAAWGPIATDSPDPADVDDALRRGCVGISLPACALAGRGALNALRPSRRRRPAGAGVAPVRGRAQRRGRPRLSPRITATPRPPARPRPGAARRASGAEPQTADRAGPGSGSAEPHVAGPGDPPVPLAPSSAPIRRTPLSRSRCGSSAATR